MDRRKKQVIVFISSTFRDMHSERDYLVKHVFPELRDWCQKKKGVTLVELDLRWGVTEEEAQGGEVINICLSEIERSRPYFIGLLGERYGWIPPEFAAPDGPILDWLKKQDSNNSITALEILKGVLDDPVMHNLAYFYVRDPAFIEEMPEEKRYEVDAESDESRQLQTELKERIRDLYGASSENLNEYHPRYGGLKLNWYQLDEKLKEELSPDEYTLIRDVGSDGFIDPGEWEQLSSALREKLLPLLMVNLEEESLEAFGAQVLENLKTAIDKRFEDKPKYTDPLDAERTAHGDFLAAKTKLFVGRDKELADGLKILTDNPVSYVWGAGGSGKSAYMANLIAKWKEADPETPSFFYFLGTTARTQNLLSTLETAYLEITRNLSLQREDFPDSALKACEFFAEFLGGLDQPILLAFDALDQLQDSDVAFGLQWLPPELPAQLTVLLSSLPGKGVENAEARTISRYHLKELSEENSRELMTQYLQHYRKKLGYDSASSTDQMALLLSRQEASLPLYLVTAAEELRIFPRYEEITTRIKQLPDTVPELFTQVIQLLESDFGVKLVERALSLMAVSRAGLTEEELLDLLAPEGLERLPAVIWSRFYLRIKAYLRGTATAEGLLGFFHRQLEEAVGERYLTDNAKVQQLHRELGDYFTRRAKGSDEAHLWETGYARGFTENVYHYLNAGDLQTGSQIFEDFAYPMEKLKNGGLGSLLHDVRTLRRTGDLSELPLLEEIVQFFVSRSAILEAGGRSWPAHAALHQMAANWAIRSSLRSKAMEYAQREGVIKWSSLRRINPPVDIQPSPETMLTHPSAVRGGFFLGEENIVTHTGGELRIWTRFGELLKIITHKGLKTVFRAADINFIAASTTILRLWSHQGDPLYSYQPNSRIKGVWQVNKSRVLVYHNNRQFVFLNFAEPNNKSTFSTGLNQVAGVNVWDEIIVLWDKSGTMEWWSQDGEQLPLSEQPQKGHGNIEIIGSTDRLHVVQFLSQEDRHYYSFNRDGSVSHHFPCPYFTAGIVRSDNWLVLGFDALLSSENHPGKPYAVALYDDKGIKVTEFTEYDGVWETATDNVILSSFQTGKTGRVKEKDLIPFSHNIYGVSNIRELDDGSFLSWGRDGKIRNFNRNGDLITSMTGFGDAIRILDVDGQHFIAKNTKDSSMLTVWDLKRNQNGVKYSHDYKISAWIRDTHGHCLTWAEGHKDYVNKIPTDTSLILWDSEGRPLQEFVGHEDYVEGALFLPNERFISWSFDNTLRLWDMSGKSLQVLKGHEDRIMNVFHTEGDFIVSMGYENSIVWKQLQDGTYQNYKDLGQLRITDNQDRGTLSINHTDTLLLDGKDLVFACTLSENRSRVSSVVRYRVPEATHQTLYVGKSVSTPRFTATAHTVAIWDRVHTKGRKTASCITVVSIERDIPESVYIFKEEVDIREVKLIDEKHLVVNTVYSFSNEQDKTAVLFMKIEDGQLSVIKVYNQMDLEDVFRNEDDEIIIRYADGSFGFFTPDFDFKSSVTEKEVLLCWPEVKSHFKHSRYAFNEQNGYEYAITEDNRLQLTNLDTEESLLLPWSSASSVQLREIDEQYRVIATSEDGDWLLLEPVLVEYGGST